VPQAYNTGFAGENPNSFERIFAGILQNASPAAEAAAAAGNPTETSTAHTAAASEVSPGQMESDLYARDRAEAERNRAVDAAHEAEKAADAAEDAVAAEDAEKDLRNRTVDATHAAREAAQMAAPAASQRPEDRVFREDFPLENINGDNVLEASLIAQEESGVRPAEALALEEAGRVQDGVVVFDPLGMAAAEAMNTEAAAAMTTAVEKVPVQGKALASASARNTAEAANAAQSAEKMAAEDAVAAGETHPENLFPTAGNGVEAPALGEDKEALQNGKKSFRGIADDVQDKQDGWKSPVLASWGPVGKQETRETTGTSREKRGARHGTVELRDYRHSAAAEVSAEAAQAGASTAQQLKAPEAELQVDLHVEALGGREALSQGQSQAANAPSNTGLSGPASAFENMLARELHQNLNNDIVRHAQVILKDGGEGVIRLSLRPESLGNVKIRLELTENKIAGHIVVESDEALRAFEREIASLEQAFKDSGYESAELDMSLAQGNQDAHKGGEGEGKPFYSPRFAVERGASRYEDTIERTDTSFETEGFKPGNRHISVNMLI
jgi:flagellar hook-length control protein FliK